MTRPSIRLTGTLKTAAALVLCATLVSIVLKLASAPLHGRYDAEQCREAYAQAKNHRDTVAVDLHLFGKGRQSTRRTCGETRTVALVSDTVLAADTLCLAARVGLPCRRD